MASPSAAERGLPSPEDHLAILDLCARYCVLLDLDDVERWVALFTEDGRFSAHGHTWEGRARLAKMMTSAPRGLHLGGVPVVEMIDQDSARSTQNLYLYPTGENAPRRAFYEDELVRSDGTWFFSSRTCQFLTSTGLQDHPEE